MTDQELDELYSALCHVMTRLGEARALDFLARFALLAMHEIGDSARLRALLAEAESAAGTGSTTR
jgi:hypothetical protein